jgi:MoaA/NifB/PqqE/SkfB family radical SAM enzyme
MCNTWKYPSKSQEELGPADYENLPFMKTINLTGGEPFLRDDLVEIIEVLKKRAKRVVVSSNGYFTDRIVKFFRENRDVGIRISIEGLPKTNDELRSLRDSFDHGLRTLVELHHMGVRDIGFATTVSDRNAKDMMELYHLAEMMGVEFATAAIHNSFYFHKVDNRFEHPDIAITELKKLVKELLRSGKIKDWFRAYFNYGLINYIEGNPRLLPCEMGSDSFFLDPYGEIFPCNVMEKSMGNLKEKSFEEIWVSKQADDVREKVMTCENNCWMIGSVSQQMKKYIGKPAKWVIHHKLSKKEIDA